MSKHTPGPWVVKHENGELLVMSSSDDFEGDPDCFYICAVHGQGTDAEEEANGQLIADAPAMLEALKFIRDTISNCQTIGSVTQYGSWEAALAAKAQELVERCSEVLNKHLDE